MNRIEIIEKAIDRALESIETHRLKRRQALLEEIRTGNRWAIQVARTEMGLRHWHHWQKGILVGMRASGCPLC